MIKKISRKIRVQGKRHAHAHVSKPPKSNLYVPKELKDPPVISKMVPPDHRKLLSKLSFDRSNQVFLADISSVEIKVPKGKKSPLIYFDKVGSVVVQKVLYKGNKKGSDPKSVQVRSNVCAPMVPGVYNVKGLQFKLDSKRASLIVTGNKETQWQQRLAA